MALLQKLKIAIKTSSEAFAGTDATIFIGLISASGGRVYRLPTRREDLEVGRLDVYTVLLPDGPDLEELAGVVLVNGMNGQSPGWRVLWVKVDGVDSEGRSWRFVDTIVEKWLDVREGGAPLVALPVLRPPEDMGLTEVVGETGTVVERVG